MADHDEGLMGAVGGGIDAGGVSNSATGSNSPMIVVKKNNILTKLFSSCSPDPRGSVHRAWGISLLFVVMYFALSIFESKFILRLRYCTTILWNCTVPLTIILSFCQQINDGWVDGSDGTVRK